MDGVITVPRQICRGSFIFGAMKNQSHDQKIIDQMMIVESLTIEFNLIKSKLLEAKKELQRLVKLRDICKN